MAARYLVPPYVSGAGGVEPVRHGLVLRIGVAAVHVQRVHHEFVAVRGFDAARTRHLKDRRLVGNSHPKTIGRPPGEFGCLPHRRSVKIHAYNFTGWPSPLR